ncbi:hypothetical protein FVE85_9648 [Porphyridium purpureum]|uniref:Uncharacterized protein n=1 Tax=Porphyridium purpureum TaxID=35688 RepID=A0A5J4YJH8_PORPP|nr:hypothetical protein FVE85_9648 [Porphyridium purpureum]|eukprot:POR2345..scf246_12
MMGGRSVAERVHVACEARQYGVVVDTMRDLNAQIEEMVRRAGGGCGFGARVDKHVYAMLLRDVSESVAVVYSDCDYAVSFVSALHARNTLVAHGLVLQLANLAQAVAPFEPLLVKMLELLLVLATCDPGRFHDSQSHALAVAVEALDRYGVWSVAGVAACDVLHALCVHEAHARELTAMYGMLVEKKLILPALACIRPIDSQQNQNHQEPAEQGSTNKGAARRLLPLLRLLSCLTHHNSTSTMGHEQQQLAKLACAVCVSAVEWDAHEDGSCAAATFGLGLMNNYVLQDTVRLYLLAGDEEEESKRHSFAAAMQAVRSWWKRYSHDDHFVMSLMGVVLACVQMDCGSDLRPTNTPAHAALTKLVHEVVEHMDRKQRWTVHVRAMREWLEHQQHHLHTEPPQAGLSQHKKQQGSSIMPAEKKAQKHQSALQGAIRKHAGAAAARAKHLQTGSRDVGSGKFETTNERARAAPWQHTRSGRLITPPLR